MHLKLNIRRSYFKSPILVMFLLVCSYALVCAQMAESYEYKIKAAFIYNFPKFIEWPESAMNNHKNFIIGIVGKDPFGDEISMLKKKMIKGKPIAIKRFATIESIDYCHILFVTKSEKNRFEQILSKVRKYHLLTVGDFENFAERGGIIYLVKEQNKIRLEINLDAANRNDLKISSKLLRLAKIVEDQ